MQDYKELYALGERGSDWKVSVSEGQPAGGWRGFEISLSRH